MRYLLSGSCKAPGHYGRDVALSLVVPIGFNSAQLAPYATVW
ncbi:protein of unknown function [Pseudorhizobium banfieldiae]|uniref:Uncharacterized protein n=1 Tax=Pseudorhizobium banfieldiae TaxID=1125847 RepID=L0NB65_9HYPH|nr:protein of unknown function [Pseudorhizobium banfieldiae]